MQGPVLDNKNSEVQQQDWSQQVRCLYAENWEKSTTDEVLGSYSVDCHDNRRRNPKPDEQCIPSLLGYSAHNIWRYPS